MNPYQIAYDLMCDLYDDHDGDIEAEDLAYMTAMDLGEETADKLPSGWLFSEAEGMCS